MTDDMIYPMDTKVTSIILSVKLFFTLQRIVIKLYFLKGKRRIKVILKNMLFL